MDGNLNIVQTNAATFNDSLSNDFIIYTATSNQNILIGTNTVDTSAINIKNSNIVFNRAINTSCNINIGDLVNPSSLLHISSNSKSYITFTNSSNNNGILMGIDNNSAGGFIFNTSNDYLRFGTSNVERMRILNTGLIGIGLSNPSYDLDIVGTERISGILYMANQVSNCMISLFSSNQPPTSGTTSFYGFGLSNGLLRYHVENSGASHVFFQSNTELARITGSGMLGIGISNPTYNLDVTGTGRYTNLLFFNNQLSNCVISLSNPNATPASTNTGYMGFGISNSALRYHINSSNDNHVFFQSNTELMRLSGTGRLGIGTSNPQYTLDVTGTMNITGAITTTGTNSVSSLLVTGTSTLCNNVSAMASISINSNLTIIGTTSTSNLLFFNNQLSNCVISLSNPNATPASTNTGYMGFGISNSALRYHINTTTDNHIFFQSNTELMRLTGIGRLGIGTNNPLFNLDVNGTMNVSGISTLSNNTLVYGTTTLSNTLTVSGISTLSNNTLVYGTTTLSNTLTVSGISTLSNNLNVSGVTVQGNVLHMNNQLSNCVISLFSSTQPPVSGTTTYLGFGVSNSALRYQLASTGDNHVFFCSNTELARITGTGRIGISNNNPQFTLDVNGTMNVSGASTLSNTLTVSGISTLSNTLTVSGISTLSNNLNVSGISTLSNNLNVSGVTTKGNLLHMNNQLSNCVISLSNPNTTPASTNTGYMGFGISNSALRYHINTTTDSHVFYQSNTELMRITGTGFIGLNNNNPTFNLDVNGTTRHTNLIHMSNQVSNCVICLFSPTQPPTSTTTSYYGFGISSGVFRYQVNLSTDNHVFFSSNTELARITGGGRLGIGISNPSYPLDVVGDINFTGTFRQNGTAYIGSQWSNSGTNVFLIGSNVGLGTSNPQCLLDIKQLSGDTYNAFINIGQQNTSSNYPGIFFANDDSFNTGRNYYKMAILAVGTGNAAIGNLAFCLNNVGNASNASFSDCRLLISSNGFIGINNNTPTYTLDVIGNERISGILHMANQVSNCMISLFSPTQPPTSTTTTYLGFGVSNSALRYQLASTGDNHVFFCSNTELARITGTGRLGIGTNNPAYSLDVTGDINFTGTFRQNGTAYIGSQWSNSGANVFLIGSNVGLGLSNPGFTLDVNGSINASNSFTALPTTFTQCNVLPTTFGLSNTLLFNSLTYTASASGSPLSPAYFAFRTNDAGWISQTLYSGSNYGGSTTTTISGSNYLGEWLQLQLPSSVTITQYLIRPNGNGTFTTNAPSKFVIGGSTDGSTWTLLDIRSNQSWPTATAITYSNLSISTPYSYYRIVALNTFNAAAGIGTSIGTLTYFYNFASSAYSMNINGGNLYAMSNIYCSNNVGIRTSNPLYSLDVFSGASLLRNGNQLGSFTSNQLLLGYGNTNTYMHAINSRHNSMSIPGNSIDFLLWNTGLLSSTIGNCNSMSITPIGVGIFNPTPLYNLDINGTTLLRNGNTATIFTSNQILLGYGTSNTYMHAINSRHNQTTGNTNSIDFLIWTSNVSPTTVGNCNSMSITATGVGIFNSNPAYELDVAGSCRVTSNLIVNGSNLSLSFGASATPTVFALNSTGTGNTTSVLQFVNSGHYIACTDSNSYDSLNKPAFGHNIYYKSGGHIFSGQAYFASQVGIGFSNAQCLLDVKQPSITGGYNGIIKISQANTSTSNYFPGIFIANDDTPTLNRYKNAILSQGDGSSGLANMAFCTNNTVNQVSTSFADCRLLISSNGNIGIGTTTPSYPLDVSGSARISTILHMNNQIANCILSLFSITQPPTSGLTNYYGFGINNGVLRYQVDGSNSSHVFFQSNTELARITGSGRIGVGNTNPSFEVDVTGSIRASTLLTSGNGASGTGTYLVMTNTNVNLGSGVGMLFGVGLSNNGSTNVNSANTAYLSMFFVNSSGSYIALGQGAGYASNLFSVNFDTGNATLKGSLTQNSDRNLKSNLSLITDPMNIINNINGYSYYKVRHNDGRKYIGLIAQEVQEVLPEVVHKNVDDNYLSVAYGDMAAVFVEAIKELNNKVTKLERENKELKDDLIKIKEHLGLSF